MLNDKIFRQAIDEFNKVKRKKETKTPSKTITISNNFKNCYLRIKSNDIENNGQQVLLAKMSCDVVKLPTTSEFFRNNVTVEGKSEKYKVSEADYKRMKALMLPYQQIFLKHKAKEVHQYETVTVADELIEVSSLAANLHRVCDRIDEIEHYDPEGINAREAQELYSAMYRITTRLNAAQFPAKLFNEKKFREIELEKIDIVKAKSSHDLNQESEENYRRIFKHYKYITPKDIDKQNKNRNNKGGDALLKREDAFKKFKAQETELQK